MNKKLNSMVLGVIIGMVAPVLAMLGYYLYNYSYMTIRSFINLIHLANSYTPLLSLCVIANLLAFFIFIWTDRLLSARGVLLSTFLYAGLVFFLKIFVGT